MWGWDILLEHLVCVKIRVLLRNHSWLQLLRGRSIIVSHFTGQLPLQTLCVMIWGDLRCLYIIVVLLAATTFLLFETVSYFIGSYFWKMLDILNLYGIRQFEKLKKTAHCAHKSNTYMSKCATKLFIVEYLWKQRQIFLYILLWLETQYDSRCYHINTTKSSTQLFNLRYSALIMFAFCQAALLIPAMLTR